MEFKPERIKQLREEQGLTLDQLSEKTGISKQVLSTWETGACEPRISSLNKMACALAIPFDFFFSNIETTVVMQEKVSAN